MKRIQTLALMLICLVAVGLATAYLAGGRTVEAQGGQIGRYQLFQGRFRANVPGVEAEDVILRLDSATGKVQRYYSGTSTKGNLTEGWRPIPDAWPPVESWLLK